MMNNQPGRYDHLLPKGTRIEDVSYYDNACRHAIEIAVANHPDWMRDAHNPGGIRRTIQFIRERCFPFELEAKTPAAKTAWGKALKGFRASLEAKSAGSIPDLNIKIKESAPVKEEAKIMATNPDEIKRFMEANGITIQAAADECGCSFTTVMSFRKKEKRKLRPQAKKFLAYLESKGYRPGEAIMTRPESIPELPVEILREVIVCMHKLADALERLANG